MAGDSETPLIEAKSAASQMDPDARRSPQLRILFVSVPMHGHINPMVPWMKECRARGHHVLFASHPSKASVAERVGADFLPVPGIVPMSEVKKRSQEGSLCDKLSLPFDVVASHNGSIYDMILKLHKAGRIDAIVSDFFVTDAVDAGDKTGVPVFIVNPNAGAFRMHNIDFWGAPSRFTGAHGSMSLWERTIAYLKTLVIFGLIVPIITLKPRYQRWVRGLRALPSGHPGFPTRESRHVYLCPTRLGFEMACLASPLVQYVGVSPPEKLLSDSDPHQDIKRLNAKLATWLKEAEGAGDRVVYAAFGSMIELKPDQTLAMYRAFTRLKAVRVVWSLKEKQQEELNKLLKRQADAAESKDTSSRVCSDKVFILSWAPQVALLKHPLVSAFLTHCGYNSTVESIICQTPMIAYPFFADQPDNATRVVSVGIGVRAPSLSPDDLAEAINEALKPDNQKRYRAQLKKIRAIMTRGGGSKRVADLLGEVAMMGGYDHLVPYEAKQGATTTVGTLAGWLLAAVKYGVVAGIGAYMAGRMC
uniref:UDP-glycosyltransferases domain-containing protein n=1 Tax=Lotharella oceanica TaxID=641309 RepID=A0A7S2TQD2_9EUKA|mmetsp:Transcript_22290/g.41840  ORF Transcript_22290/g.41840 Transcript_22290/m.41840 type:complete len:533 (+) Transcript_22290:96-1694(+)|eukprot:CAMPEP_0170188628 /NCGR_PEP_ID=MMETSP0040_2-20121228/44815_1 /TAXON_ID=641309 /ORGANISM="Lotharella oceanica, Strain CCMP622" /LENGTH=532 /DNA_ID=CAMNT_0010435967 /DNA_START=81 /DNA_END=1679 /DNA_ORIENTATION=-